MICKKCGKEIKDTAKFCPYCGTDNKAAAAKPEGTPVPPPEEKPAGTPAPPNKGKKGCLPIIVAGILAVAVFAAALFMFLRGKGAEDGQKQESEILKAETEVNETSVKEKSKAAESGTKESEAESSGEEKSPIGTETFNTMENGGIIDAEKERETIVILYREIQDHLEEYIREEKGGVIHYSSLDGKYEKCVKKASGSEENKEYFFEDGELRFAYYYSGSIEKRFYFKARNMFRYIDPQKITHDLEFGMAEWEELEQNVLDEAERCRKPHSYEVVLKDCTWEEAWAEARRMGGCLVRFDTAEEFDDVMGQLGSANIKNKLWIGGRRAPGSNVYHWLNEDGTYQTGVINGEAYAGLWMKNEPSFRDQGVEEEYLNLFYYEKEGRWVLNDVPNDILAVVGGYAGTVGFIVEFE